MTALPIRFVLVDTSHPGNIGAAARAMKNMELADLALVRPRQFPHPEALARSSGADDLLARARVCATLNEALGGCGLVLACTARLRDHYYRVLDVRDAAARAVAESAASPVAIVFGAEQSGLSNEDLAPAHALLRIPTGAAYASLNLAMAVQVVAYEILRARRAAASGAASIAPAPVREAPLADPAAMERLYTHLEAVLELIDFRDRTQAGNNLMKRIRRFLQRAELDGNEVNILRGVLTAVQQRRHRAGEREPAP
jgi:TrmH family RNA methyltransferase